VAPRGGSGESAPRIGRSASTLYGCVTGGSTTGYGHNRPLEIRGATGSYILITAIAKNENTGVDCCTASGRTRPKAEIAS
jgi:hypothetical protein